MKSYQVRLQSEVSKSFRCQKAANSLDIDTEKKSIHELSVAADIDSPFNVGLIVGASGSGKTTLAKEIFVKSCFYDLVTTDTPIIDQLPKFWTYDQCAEALTGMGLTSVPCWIRPAKTLSNGQRARAEAVLKLACETEIPVIDEWTSVVDRTVAKVMSHCVQKYARRNEKKVVLLSCHYDVIEWLNPCWIIDCNKQEFINRRAMVGTFERTDRLRFDLRECSRKSWQFFSKYHYLSDKLPAGNIFTFGLFHGREQIGFQCFAAYIVGDHKTQFFNRTVIHPDYAGMGLGIHMINEASKIMVQRGYRVRGKFSSTPVYKALSKSPLWRCNEVRQNIKAGRVGRVVTKQGTRGVPASRASTLRQKVTTYHFEFLGD